MAAEVCSRAVAASVLLTVAAAAAAQGQPPAAAALPLWEAGVIGGVASAPAYPGAADRSSRILASPWFVYRGEWLRAEDGTFGARLLRTDAVQLDVGFAGSLAARSADVAARAGMPDIGYLGEFGPRLKVKLADSGAGNTVRLDLPLRAVFELNGGLHHRGYAFEPELHWSRRLDAGAALGVSAGLVWGSRALNEFFYGVAPTYATATRPAYAARPGYLGARLGASLRKPLSRDLTLYTYARLDQHGGSANRDSPLFQRRSGAFVGVALSWTLGRSGQGGHD